MGFIIGMFDDCKLNYKDDKCLKIEDLNWGWGVGISLQREFSAISGDYLFLLINNIYFFFITGVLLLTFSG